MDEIVNNMGKSNAIKATKFTRCVTCGRPYSKRLRRSRWVKYLLFFLPLRRYYCAKCRVIRYVLHTRTD